MKKRTIVSLVSVLLLGFGAGLLSADGTYRNCKFFIKNNTNGKIAIQPLDETGMQRKMVEIRKGKQKGFTNMFDVLFELSSKPAYGRNGYISHGQFKLAVCPDTKTTFDATDFINYSGMVQEYFTSDVMKPDIMVTEAVELVEAPPAEDMSPYLMGTEYSEELMEDY